MATSEEYAAWIVKNADKKGTPEFDTVAAAYADSRKPAATTKEAAPSKPFGQQLNENIESIPRQIGLTARHGLKAVGNTVGMLSDPIGGTINALTGSKLKTAGSLASSFSDAIGLPSPANVTERVVGDTTEMMASAGGMSGAARQAAGYLSGAPKFVANALAANPLQQMASGAAAGGAGGYTRETGGNGVAQFLASLAAGVAAPMAANGLMKAGESANKLFSSIGKPQSAPSNQIDVTINNALQSSGMVLSDLPANIQTGIRSDVASALKTNGALDANALRRLADYRMTGATPTNATLTLDPASVTRQQNLAKLGINSKDAAAQQLGRTANENNRLLIGGLNDLGAATTDTALSGGKKVMGALTARNDRANALIDAKYKQARATDGRSAALDPQAFATRADELLTHNLRNAELPADIRTTLNSFASGETPLTIETAEQFKTIMAKVQRTSSDGGVRDAISHVRSALDETPLLQGQPLGAGSQAAFDSARSLNRKYMGIVERTPALQAVRDGIEPDKFVQKFIVGNGEKANVSDLNALKASIKSSPEAMQSVREQIAAHLKSQALNGAADEVGNLSQSAFNKALNGIGDSKLSMFFKPDEVRQLKAIGRVASYEQFQPKGSAVNNSNTAGTAIANVLDRIGGSSMLSKVPLGNLLSAPAQNISLGMRSADALKVPNALIGYMPKQARSNLLMSPAVFMASEQDK